MSSTLLLAHVGAGHKALIPLTTRLTWDSAFDLGIVSYGSINKKELNWNAIWQKWNSI